MARRRRTNILEDITEIMEMIFRYVSPWVSVPLAIAAFVGVSAWVNSRLKTPGTEKLGYLLGGMIAVPILIGGYRYRQQRAAFLRQNITLDWVNSLTWQEFENCGRRDFPRPWLPGREHRRRRR